MISFDLGPFPRQIRLRSCTHEQFKRSRVFEWKTNKAKTRISTRFGYFSCSVVFLSFSPLPCLCLVQPSLISLSSTYIACEQRDALANNIPTGCPDKRLTEKRMLPNRLVSLNEHVFVFKLARKYQFDLIPSTVIFLLPPIAIPVCKYPGHAFCLAFS